jgi:hypothetical protein
MFIFHANFAQGNKLKRMRVKAMLGVQHARA